MSLEEEVALLCCCCIIAHVGICIVPNLRRMFFQRELLTVLGCKFFLIAGRRPSMSRAKNEKGKSKVSVGEAASRVGMQVYHTGQGQDERAHTRPSHHLRGLDSAWSVTSNPHRESGTRWRAAADVGQAGMPEGAIHGRQEVRFGDRLGDSVGQGSLTS